MPKMVLKMKLRCEYAAADEFIDKLPNKFDTMIGETECFIRRTKTTYLNS